MNKIISGLLLAGLCSVSAQADFIRVEAGLGVWGQNIDGDIQYDGEAAFTTDTLGYDTENNLYVWAFIKHPVPILPNLRLEYAEVDFAGTSSQGFTFNGETFSADADSSLSMNQFDAAMYYNILDNTFWTTIDLGLDIKSMTGDFSASSTGSSVNGSETVVLPLLYGRGRVEIPVTDIGVEAEVKYVGFGDSEVLDASIKVDYTLVGFIPFMDFGIEAGYRTQSLVLDSGDVSSLDSAVDLNVDGVFLGLVGRF